MPAYDLGCRARSRGSWAVLESSKGLLLPDRSVRSPDVSVMRLERSQALSRTGGKFPGLGITLNEIWAIRHHPSPQQLPQEL